MRRFLMGGERGRSLAALTATGFALIILALGIVVLHVSTASAHNVTAHPSSSCTGWSYVGSYNNGGGGGAGDNRLVIVDVSIGGTVIKQYQYFDTLTTHPAAPAGFSIVDHTTLVSFELFNLKGTSFPVETSGSIKIYQHSSTTSSASSDPYYNEYLPDSSVNPIPAVQSPTNCPTATRSSTATATRTNTATATPSETKTSTPTDTSTATSTPIHTATSTDTATAIPTHTTTAIPTHTVTDTATAIPTHTTTAIPTHTATATQTATNTSTPTGTAAPTNTPTATNTPPSTIISTATATSTSTGAVIATQVVPGAVIATPVVPRPSATLVVAVLPARSTPQPAGTLPNAGEGFGPISGGYTGVLAVLGILGLLSISACGSALRLRGPKR